MNKQIIIRLWSFEGKHRIIVNTSLTYGELLLEISKKLNHPVKSLIVSAENGRPFKNNQSAKIGSIPYFVDGAVVKVETNQPQKVSHSGLTTTDIQNQQTSLKCNHPPGGKCLNCIEIGSQQSKTNKKGESEKPNCNHGPSGKCLNCVQVDLKDKKGVAKMLCQHGAHAKCVHCLDQEFIADAAHVSFDNWLEQKKLKCKGVHSIEVKCNNCLPPSKIRYEVDKTCKNHEAYPKAMCNKCIPPNVVIKRQEYRHVDYVQFMNIAQIQDFIRYWLPRRHEQQRAAFLYGYYAEDPHYKGGIRVIVEALYEPLQTGTYGGFEILEQEENPKLQSVVTGLTLEKVGWIFTETNHDVVMSEKHARMAANFQEQYRVPHESGYDISNFITVILRPDEKNENQVLPEVYMISDQGQALEKSGLFIDSNSRRKMQVKVKEDPNDAYPSFICGGKSVTEFEPEFLLVKIAHGSSKNNKFSILKKSEFPSLNRDKPTKKNLKDFMLKNKYAKPQWLKYSDFNLLMYLAEEMDPATAHSIAESVVREEKVSEHIVEMVEQMSDL